MAEELEETQIELRATVCTLDEASLRELCAELQIELKEKTGRLDLIQRITKYLDAEELNVEKLQKLKEAIADKKKPPAKIKSEKETEQKPGFQEACTRSYHSRKSLKYQARLEIRVKRIDSILQAWPTKLMLG